MTMPWDVTFENVKFVLKQNNIKKSKKEVEKICSSIDEKRVMLAALDGIDFVDQVELAIEEIEKILIENGIIKKITA